MRIVQVCVLYTRFYGNTIRLCVYLLGCELKGSVTSSLEHDGSFILMLTDDVHCDEEYDRLQTALELVLMHYHRHRRHHRHCGVHSDDQYHMLQSALK